VGGFIFIIALSQLRPILILPDWPLASSEKTKKNFDAKVLDVCGGWSTMAA
jgi:hypothetical protein